MKRFILLLSFCTITLGLAAQSVTWSEVRVRAGRPEMDRLSGMGLAVGEGHHDKDGTWTTVLTQAELEKVKAAGLPVEVIHADYAGYIAARNRAMMAEVDYINHHREQFKSTDVSNYAVPQHFRLGSMGGYLTQDEVINQLDSMRLLFPGLISVKTAAGNTATIEGRTVWYVMISNTPNQVTSRPKVLYNALTHAREPMGMQQMIFFMWYLLENYGTSEEVKYMVDNLQLFFIPVANPDGYQFNCSGFPSGGGMWRKNRRDNGGGAWGVDLNRNYGFKWGYDNNGSSPVPTDETYRGTTPFSEPETQIMRDFCTDHVFSIVQNFHTYSDYVLYPWCWETANTPDSSLQLAYVRYLTRENGYLTGHPGEILYNTNGDAMDWQYGEQTTKPKAICFTTEIGTSADGFWPFANRIIPLAQENMYANLMIAHLALRYAEAGDVSPVILSSRQGFFHYEFVRYGMDSPGSYTVTMKPVDSTQFISWGGPRTFANPVQLQPYPDSVDYLLRPEITSGDAIRFVYEVSNGLYTFRDTVVKYFGPPLVIFSDSCNTMANWTSTKWNVTTSKYHSPPSCITDSPSGNYGNNANATINALVSLDMKGSPVAVISYWARWRTEQGYDFTQFRLQGNLGPWVPQKGNYTKTSFYQQASNQPLYDGNQYDWVKEQIVTTDFTTKSMGMQFLLKSDMSMTYDGFYFDDVTVTVVDMTKVGMEPRHAALPGLSAPVPNPATGEVTVKTIPAGEPLWEGAVFILADSRGVVVKQVPLREPFTGVTFSVAGLAPGVYFYRISGIFGSPEFKKLIVIH